MLFSLPVPCRQRAPVETAERIVQMREGLGGSLIDFPVIPAIFQVIETPRTPAWTCQIFPGHDKSCLGGNFAS
jgi:hypothetical protein